MQNKEISKLKITDVASLKRWLAMYENLRDEIQCQSGRLSKLEERMGEVGSPSFSGMPSNPPTTNDRRADMIASIIDLQKEVNELYDYYESLTQEIEWCIRYMANPGERVIIRMRYIDAADWKDINDVLFCNKPDFNEKKESYQRRIYLIHGTALKNLAEVASKRMK